jgi:hypothetical protein
MKGIRAPWHGWAGWVLVALLVGCAGGGARSFPVYVRYHGASPPPFPRDSGAGGTVTEAPVRVPAGTVLVGGPGERLRQAVELGLLRVDAFERLLIRAGLESRPSLPEPFTPRDAEAVLGRLLASPVTLGTFPPRMAAGFVLREVMAGGPASREELVRRVERFSQVAVLRPDGYLAWALDGRTQQRVEPVRWRDGALGAGNFELGRLYSGRGGVFRPVDGQLRATDWKPLAEVYDDADVISRSLDGAEDAFVELYHALGQLLSKPVDSLAELGRLPEGVAALLRSSPEYWERFQHMTEGEQIREVARLTTSGLLLWGTASSTARTLTRVVSAEATVPVLTVSARGTLALEQVAVPVGRAAAVLSGGPGAAVIVQKAQASPAPEEPGQWGPSNESMSPRARRYQEQISGHSADEAYWVGGADRNSGGVKFDGFSDGVLKEAKGPGYAKMFSDNLEPKGWFRRTGATDLVEQANRQARVARARGVRIEWHVAEEKVARALRELLRAEPVPEITILHTPAH